MYRYSTLVSPDPNLDAPRLRILRPACRSLELGLTRPLPISLSHPCGFLPPVTPAPDRTHHSPGPVSIQPD